MLKASSVPRKERSSSGSSSMSSFDDALDAVGHVDVGQIVGVFFDQFPEHGDTEEFVISTGDRCRAQLDHPGVSGWWRNYIITRGPTGLIATPYLATIPKMVFGRTFNFTYPYAYSGESLFAVNTSILQHSGISNCSDSCGKVPVGAGLTVGRRNGDGSGSFSHNSFIANEAKLISPAEDDFSVVRSMSTYSASLDYPDDYPTFIIFAVQSEDDVNQDIPLSVKDDAP